MKFYYTSKKIFDFIVTSIALLLISPIFLVIGILIKLDSKGPVFYVRDRVGKNGKLFKFFKFRSMTIDTPNTGMADISENDPHITRVGRVLRDFTLDELPQFINIIKGDMSLVGPRPLPLDDVQDPQLKALWQKRISVTPGLICMSDLKGRNSLSWQQRFEYDSWYIDNQSFWLDLKILIVGFFAVLSRKGVYEDGKTKE